MLNDVFATWGERAGDRPARRTADVIAAVQRASRLRLRRRGVLGPRVGPPATGVRHCYDKRLYDRMLHERNPKPSGGTSTPSWTTSSDSVPASSRTTTNRGRGRLAPEVQPHRGLSSPSFIPGLRSLSTTANPTAAAYHLSVHLGRRPDEWPAGRRIAGGRRATGRAPVKRPEAHAQALELPP